jgi:polar amino acid transport system ATP-binding protein
MSNTNLLEVRGIKKSFGDLQVLKDISLSVAESEVISILGPSGSGKSTLLRCMTMLEKIDGGSMSYCSETAVSDESGEPIYAPKADLKRIQGYFGLVFQNFNLFPHYTVMKNITDAPIHVQKRNRDEVAAEAADLLDKMGLSDKGDYYPYQLSGGQQQRVAIARALAMKPRMLFFDEPTSALDPELTAEILKVLRELAAEKMTMVIVTHEIDFARSVSDRVIFMDGGLIVEEGAPCDVIDNPKNERTRNFLKKMTDEN